MFKLFVSATVASFLFATVPSNNAFAWESPSQKAYNNAIAKAKASAAANSNSAAASGSNANAGGANVNGDKYEGGWGFTYVRNPTAVPMAVATPDVVVTSMGVEIGPLGSYSDQSVKLTPGGLESMSEVLNKASTYDGTEYGRARAMNYAAVICAKEPEIAKIRFGDKCNDLASIFPVKE